MKRFCAQLSPHLAAFVDAIQAIPDKQERQAYGLLLLLRLMFLYFLQQHGLLDGNYHYLSHNLQRMQARQQNTFYVHFLLPLFYEWNIVHDCNVVGTSISASAGQFIAGGRANAGPYDVTIADNAFADLFAFFDTYHWRLIDEDPQTEQTLSPAILGYIFEQQINQKQMGAYYTSDDVTGYVARTTIIPCLFQMLARAHPDLFSAHAVIWQCLRDTPERYILMSIATPCYLPTETEREYTSRRKCYEQLYEHLSTGTVCTINDLVTLNLDIQRFASDVLTQCNSTALLLTCYSTLTHMNILDPTCGTGAFLCAAAQVLELLYTACLQRLCTLAENDVPCEELHAISHNVAAFSNLHYASVHNILTYNLYGVDIMGEAVEICRQRLLLMLLTYTQPQLVPGGAGVDRLREGDPSIPASTGINDLLPDLSKTIRVGNTLSGATSAEEMALLLTPQHTTHAEPPFHWHHEFPAVMEQGGFDVIIGNPPYIEYSKLALDNNQYDYTKSKQGNLYAAVLERSLILCRNGQSYLGLIVPISLCTSKRFAPLRQMIMQKTEVQWLANFEIFPCRLFEGAFQRLCLLIAQHRSPSHSHPPILHVTKLQRWYTAERPHLIATMSYTQTQRILRRDVFPKLASPLHETILEKLLHRAQGDSITTRLSPLRTKHVVYYQEATNYWVKATCALPFYKKNGVEQIPSHGRFLFFHDTHTAQVVMALLNSSLFYLWFASYSDGFHLAHALVKAFPTGQGLYELAALPLLAQRLEQDILQYVQMSTRNTKLGANIEIAEYRMACSKPLLDQIDYVLAQYYGLDDAEYDFIVHYDSKYRRGR